MEWSLERHHLVVDTPDTEAPSELALPVQQVDPVAARGSAHPELLGIEPLPLSLLHLLFGYNRLTVQVDAYGAGLGGPSGVGDADNTDGHGFRSLTHLFEPRVEVLAGHNGFIHDIGGGEEKGGQDGWTLILRLRARNGDRQTAQGEDYDGDATGCDAGGENAFSKHSVWIVE